MSDKCSLSSFLVSLAVAAALIVMFIVSAKNEIHINKLNHRIDLLEERLEKTENAVADIDAAVVDMQDYYSSDSVYFGTK